MGTLVRAIENPARELPIVVISRDRMGSILVDPKHVGEELLSIAKVAVLATPNVADELGKQLRWKFPCFNGYARVFDVGFTHEDSRNRHRVWDPQTFVGRNEHLVALLCQDVIREAARWVEPDQVIADLPRQRLQRGVAASLAREIEKEGLASEFLELSQSYEQDIAQARADLAAKDDELREKSEEIYKLRARVADLDHALNGNDLHLEAPTDTVPVALAATSLLDAVRIAQDEADWAAIEFLPAAFESAKRVQVDDPNDALTKLRALIDVAQDFHDSPGDGTWIKKAFEQRGIRYSPKVGPSTKGQHADDYTCLWDNNGEPRKISFDSHIRLSQRHRVYWYEAKQERKFVVGHVGDHLPN